MYQLTASQHFDLDDIANRWRALYQRTQEASVFLDWSWIGNWVTQVRHLNPICIQINHTDEAVGEDGNDTESILVGLAFFCITTRNVYGIPIKQGFLHRTGIEEFDQPWIEFNDILALPEHKSECASQILNWCKSQAVDEWIFALCKDTTHWQSTSVFDSDVDTTMGYAVTLDNNWHTLDDYLNRLSANSRSNLRRTKKYIEQTYGKVRFEVLPAPLDQNHWRNMARLHASRWQHTSQGSGFTNPHFVDFHQQLAASTSACSRVEVLVFYTGDRLLGYLYNLIGGNSVNFYLSAIDYFDTQHKFQPGLLMHAMAIVHYADQPLTKYDFMGGDMRYKRSLSDNKYPLFYLELRRHSIKNSAIDYLKKLKLQLVNAVSKLQQKREKNASIQ